MQYQDFEKRLPGVFANNSEPVDMAALLAGIHDEQSPKKAIGWKWGILFGLCVVLGLAGLNYVIKQNHSEQLDVYESQMLKAAETATGSASQGDTPLQSERSIATDVHTSEESNAAASDSDSAANSPLGATRTATVTKPSQESSQESSLPDHSSAQLNASSPSTAAYYAQSSKEQQATFNSPAVVSSRAVSTAAQSTKLPTTALQSRKLLSVVTLSTPASTGMDLAAIAAQMPQKGYVDCPSFSERTEWHFDIIPELGVIAPLKSLSPRGDITSEAYDMRTQDETPLEGLQAALYGRLRVGAAPYYLKAGASYTRISERMRLDINYVERDTSIGIISITESQNGDTLTVVRGEIITETEFSRKSTDHYYLHMIDIPVAVGYSSPLGGGWRLGGEVGAQFNIGLSSRGKLLESSDTYTALPATGRFAPSLGVSFFAGVMLEKAVGRRSSIYLSPRFRYFPSSFTPESYNINQEYQFVGLHAGYIYSF